MAQLKDLIVNGPTRLIGPAYGLISSASTSLSATTAVSAVTSNSATTSTSAKTAYSASTATSATTVPVINCAATLSFGTTKTIATVGGYNVTVTIPNGGYQGDQGDQGAQGSDGYMIYCGVDTELTGLSNDVWTGRTGSYSGVGKTVKFTNIAGSKVGRRDIIIGDYVLFWGQDTDNNGHINIARITNLAAGANVSFNVTGTVVSAIVAPKGAQGDQGANGSSAEGSSLSVKGAATTTRCHLLGTNSTDSTGSTVLLTSGNTFRAGATTSSGVYYLGNVLYASSDERLKDFIGDIEVDLDTIGNIPKKYYTWKNDEGKKVQIGTSAQELNKIYPELVDGDETGMLAVGYDRLSIVALAAIDKLHYENEKLKEKIALLEDKIDTLLNK